MLYYSLFILKCDGRLLAPGSAACLFIWMDLACIAGERIGVGEDTVVLVVGLFELLKEDIGLSLFASIVELL